MICYLLYLYLYILLRFRIVALYTGCPFSWISRYNSCYKMSLRKNEPYESAEYCASIGGHLLVLDDEAEVAFIQSALSSVSWFVDVFRWFIGLRRTYLDTFRNNYLTWATGYSTSSLPFNLGNEDNKFGFIQGNVYDMVSSSTKQHFICEKSASKLWISIHFSTRYTVLRWSMWSRGAETI